MRRDLRGPLIWFAACVVVAVIAFAYYAVHRQQIADERNEKQRAAICAILANIPGKVPAEIQNARLVFARPGHPRDCQPLGKRHPTPAPSPTPEPPRTSLVIVQPRAPAATTTSPRATATASPRPTPSRSPSHSPTPKPSPSPSCVEVNPLGHSIHIC